MHLFKQIIPTKLIKNELSIPKEMKPENFHQLQQQLSFSNMFQRHGMGLAPTPQQLNSREDELRRYKLLNDRYFYINIYVHVI